MYKVRVLQEIDDRLDAEYYNPSALSTLKKMETKGTVTTFGSLVDEGYRVVYHGTDHINGLKDSDLLPFLSPTQIDANGAISFEDTDKLPLYYKDRYPKGLGKAGEILVEVKGNVSKVSIVPLEFPKNLMISGSLYKATLDSKRADSHYVLAFLKSKHGQILKNRLTSNTIINYIAKDALYSIPVIEFGGRAQKYIGDKVRQAEQLRAWAKRLERKLLLIENQIPISEPIVKEGKHSKANLEFLTENRLDARFYSKKHLDLYAQFTNGFESLGSICSGFKYGASIAANYVNSDGLPFIRGNALSPNRINQEDMVYLNKSLADKVGTAYVEEGDILITRSGTVGVTTYIAADYAKYAFGSFIIKCKLESNLFLPAYISWYLNSWVGQQQFRRLENGAVQLNINIEELSSIAVWKAPQGFQAEIQQLLVEQISAVNLSKSLTCTAKILVEALIEGQLTEQQLIQAQQALEDGDTGLDQAILSKLSNEGFAVEGAKPLFGDLDELYRLLESAAQSEDEE